MQETKSQNSHQVSAVQERRLPALSQLGRLHKSKSISATFRTVFDMTSFFEMTSFILSLVSENRQRRRRLGWIGLPGHRRTSASIVSEITRRTTLDLPNSLADQEMSDLPYGNRHFDKSPQHEELSVLSKAITRPGARPTILGGDDKR